jgi:hypothetical protein
MHASREGTNEGPRRLSAAVEVDFRGMERPVAVGAWQTQRPLIIFIIVQVQVPRNRMQVLVSVTMYPAALSNMWHLQT